MSKYLLRFFVLLLSLAVVGCDPFDEKKGLAPFGDFLDGVRRAEFEPYAAREDSRVRDKPAFQQMRKHILEMYDGAERTHSFELDGRVVDCIRIETQPSVRLLGIKEVDRRPPGLTEGDHNVYDGKEPGAREFAASPLTLGKTDIYGNPVRCKEGSIPMTRLTLEMLVRYETLRHFFSKGQDGTGFYPRPQTEQKQPRPEESSSARRYAFVYQTVRNFGGNSWLNLWNPSIGRDGTMSLSQHWYSAGSGVGTQTLEGGWQVLPRSTPPTMQCSSSTGPPTITRAPVAITSTARASCRSTRTGISAVSGVLTVALVQPSGASSCSTNCSATTGGCS